MHVINRLALRLACLVLASAFAAGAFVVSAAESKQGSVGVEIALGCQTPLMLKGEDAVYTFRPEANSMYGIYLFAQEESADWLSARLYGSSAREVAVGSASEGAPCAITARLSAGERYRLVISGAGRATLEIARKTLGRCFDDPIRLDASGSYAKLIARAGDAHWYAFRAEDTVPVTVGIVPEESGLVHLNAALLNSAGAVRSESLHMEDGACAVYAEVMEGETCYLRVEAGEGETGGYRLQVLAEAREAVAPKSLELSETELVLEVGGRRRLRTALTPESAAQTLLWRSRDPSVAVVTGNGEVIAVGAGETTVTAYGYGGIAASCKVEARGLPLTGVHFNAREINLRVGETIQLDYSFEPVGAYTRDVAFAVGDDAIAAVDALGQLTAVGEGETVVRLRAEGDLYADALRVYVEPAAPRYRALLTAEQLYDPSVNKVRTGAINTVENLNAMLSTYELDGQSYESQTLLDATRDELIAALHSAFAGAAPQDVSLFYITCHGYYANGMSYLQFRDGSLLSAVDLERELRGIPGTVVVLIDCCGSGGFLGRAAALADFNRGVIAAFAGRNGGPVLNSSKYKVLTSALLEEDSYRLSFDEDLSESAMATVFARALADGAGWNVARSRRAAMRADADMDRSLSLQELYLYAARRVTWYLKLVGGSYHQNVQVWPVGDPFVLFGRPAS